MDGLPDLPHVPGQPPSPPTGPAAPETARQPEHVDHIAHSADGERVDTGPPSVWPAPQPAGPAPYQSLTPGSTVVLPRPRQRRRRWPAVLAVVVLAAVAAGVYLLRPSDHEHAGYSLTAAADDAGRHSLVHFTQAVGTVGHEIVAEAELDDTAQLAHVTVDLTTDGIFEAIIDRKANVAYFNSEFFNDIGYEVDTDWVKADEDFLKEQTGDGFDPFSGAAVDNPLAVGALLDDATSVEDLGAVTIHGEQLRRYRVTVPADTAAKVSPQIQQQVASNDADLPDDIVFDVYVGRDNTIRRTVVALDLGATKVTIDSTITAVDEELSVEVPADRDTSDAADVLG